MLKNACIDLENEYNTLMNSLQVAVSKHLLDENFTVIWANDLYFEKIGYSRQEYAEIYHNHVSEYFRDDQETLAKMSKIVLTAYENGQPDYSFICKMHVKGGGSMWIRVRGTFTDEVMDGRQVLYTAFTDVTDIMQMRTEQSVTYDNLPGFVAKFQIREGTGDERFLLLDANDKFINFFGEPCASDLHTLKNPDTEAHRISLDEHYPVLRQGKTTSFVRQMSGQRPHACDSYALTNLDTETNRMTLDEYYPVLRQGQATSFVLQAVSARGKKSWFQLNAACIEHIQDDPVYFIIYIDITDVTEQRTLRQKLEKRTDQLDKALRMAKKANQAKSDFLSRMSHDIRTPMNAILGMLSLAKQSRDNPERLWDCLTTVENSAKFLLSLINDILDMSKIESGKMTLSPARFDLTALLRDITSMFYSYSKEKQVHFNVSIAANLDEAFIGDKLKLNRILINLLGNAVKFTAPGGTVTLSAGVGQRSGKATELFFEVKDTGKGMDPSFLDKLFRPFEQDLHTENTGGTGLGLAIADHYARMMNGDIQVESALGRGSTFKTRVWMENAALEIPAGLKERFGHIRALLLQPDLEGGEHLKALLDKLGVTAERACSVAAASELLETAREKNQPYAVLIVDWESARDEAATLIQTVRQRFGADAPSIAIAAYNWSVVSLPGGASASAGIAYLPKPLSSSLIYDFLCSVAGGASAAADALDKTSFNGERVLLVEDNDINMQIATAILETQNIRVETARDGLEAVNAFKNSEPKRYLAILMDIRMPVLSGLEATRRIRTLPREDALTVPIIAMSANAFDEDVKASLDAGMNAHLSKPIDIPSLFSTLQYVRKEQRPVMAGSDSKGPGCG